VKSTALIEGVTVEGEEGRSFTLYVTDRRVVGVAQDGKLLYAVRSGNLPQD